jgi:hypothetical protein
MCPAVLYTTVWSISWRKDVSCCVVHNSVKYVVKKMCVLLCSTQKCEEYRKEKMCLALLYTTVWRMSWKKYVSCFVVHNCVKDVVKKRCVLLCCTQLCEGCREEKICSAVLYTTVWRMSWRKNVFCCVVHNCVKDVVRIKCLLLYCTKLCEWCRWSTGICCCVVRNDLKNLVRYTNNLYDSQKGKTRIVILLVVTIFNQSYRYQNFREKCWKYNKSLL